MGRLPVRDVARKRETVLTVADAAVQGVCVPHFRSAACARVFGKREKKKGSKSGRGQRPKVMYALPADRKETRSVERFTTKVRFFFFFFRQYCRNFSVA